MTDRFLTCLYGFTLLPGEDGQPYHVTAGDRGGPTNMGVTLATYTGWQHDHGVFTVTAADLKNATAAEIEEIYRTKFWAPDASQLPLGLDLIVFDIAVGAGPGRAARILQQAVGVMADGLIGPITLQAVARVGLGDLLLSVTEAYLAFVRRLPDWTLFGNGWAARAAARLALALKMAGVGVSAPPVPAVPVYETEAAAALRTSQILERLQSMSDTIMPAIASLKTAVDTLSASEAAANARVTATITVNTQMATDLADVTAKLATANAALAANDPTAARAALAEVTTTVGTITAAMDTIDMTPVVPVAPGGAPITA